MAITLEQWQTRLDAYLAAEVAVLSNQEYEIEAATGRRRLRRADLGEIRRGIAECNQAIARLTPPAPSGGRTRYLVSE
jgi:hypothetical protein